MNMDDPFADLHPDDRFAPMESYAPSQSKPVSFVFVAVGDLEYKEPEFLIDGLIETDTLGMIFGDPGCGKSFVAVDIGLSVASGTPFHDRSVKQGSVFFIAGEGHNGLARRFAAWAIDRGVSLTGVPLFKSERAAHFLDAASANAVSKSVDALAKSHGEPTLIIVDTVARNFGAGDENSTSDMSNFIAAIDDLKARYPGCAVLLVHHSGHGDKQRARGAMALKGALDCEFRVEPAEGIAMQIVNTKMKDAEPPAPMAFVFHPVDLVGGAKSVVLRATDAPKRQSRVSPSQKLGIKTYTTAAIGGGVWDNGALRGVHVDEWRDAFYAKHTGDNTDAKKKAFQRVRSDLVNNGQMKVESDIYLTTDGTIQTEIMIERDRRDIAGHS